MASKEVVPVKELKRQIDMIRSQNTGSLYLDFYEEVHSTWSKYPCEIETTCKNTHCFGRIYIEMKDNIDRLLIFQLEVIAIRSEKSTYILMDAQFHDLIERGGFEECHTEMVHY